MLQTTITFTMTVDRMPTTTCCHREATLGVNLRFIPPSRHKKAYPSCAQTGGKHGLEMKSSAPNAIAPAGGHQRGGLYPGGAGHWLGDIPGLAVSPYVMTGATDAYYQEFVRAVFVLRGHLRARSRYEGHARAE